jgi:hypothetical protein
MEALHFYPNPAASDLPSFPFFDPFLASKRRGLRSALPSMEALAPKVTHTGAAAAVKSATVAFKLSALVPSLDTPVFSHFHFPTANSRLV